jgi:hypothetical protein
LTARESTVPEAAEIRELQEVQNRRAKHETEQARRASDEEERATHERRADKAAHLRDKRAEQAGWPGARIPAACSRTGSCSARAWPA